MLTRVRELRATLTFAESARRQGDVIGYAHPNLIVRMSDGMATPEIVQRLDSVSATAPDWSRESKTLFAWEPGRSLLASLRSYERWCQASDCPWSFFMRKVAVLRHKFWSVITGAEIPLGTRISGGLMLPHPNGIVIHPDVVIGPNCLIFQQVTLGSGNHGVPCIGGHVDIGTGAKILGAVTLGNHSKVGANAVVLRDVPAFATAVGIPARNIIAAPMGASLSAVGKVAED